VHDFHLEADDGARLWIGNNLITDEFEASDHNEWSAATDFVMDEDRLYPIKVEYREVVGSATVRLFWSSSSQPRIIIPPHRLHATRHLRFSIFLSKVAAMPIKPTPPEDFTLENVDEANLLVTSSPPLNDGGAAVTSYKIEWRPSDARYGNNEVHSLVFRDGTNGEFSLAFSGSHTVSIKHGSETLEENALAIKAALEQLPTLNDVSVSYTIDGQYQIFHVEFETNVPTAVEFTVSSAGLSISDVDVCAGADDAAPCSSALGDIGERAASVTATRL